MNPNQEEIDKQNVALHEAGHMLIAENYGLACWAYLVRVGEPTADDNSHVGRTHYERTTPYRAAVLAFGGPIADYLRSIAPQGEWHDEDWTEFAFYLESDENAASPSDRSGMNHPLRTRALKTAWKIIIEKRARLFELAERIKLDVRPELQS